jgi:hypothetical protein
MPTHQKSTRHEQPDVPKLDRSGEVRVEKEQLTPQVGAPEKLLPNSGLNSLLPARDRQAKWNLTPTEDTFARVYVETGNLNAAMKAAGTNDSMAKKMLTRDRVWTFIEKYLSACLTRGAVVGYNLVLNLAQHTANENIKMKSAQWLYDKWENRILRDAGIFAARTDTPSDLTSIQARIADLSKTLNLNIQVNAPSERSDHSARVIDAERSEQRGNSEWN